MWAVCYVSLSWWASGLHQCLLRIGRVCAHVMQTSSALLLAGAVMK
jgi:hypothetical protein